jgi:hypothetical protein
MSWKSLVDKALGTNFDAPQYDPQKGRDKLVRQIDLAAKQHSEGTTRAPNRAWKAGGNNAIRFGAKVDGKPVLLDGDKEVYVPAEHFQSFLKHLKTSVQAGELDKDIKAAMESGPKVAPSIAGARKRSAAGGEKPYAAREGYAELSRSDKQKISAFYRFGKNPDGSVIADVGHKPNAPLAS